MSVIDVKMFGASWCAPCQKTKPQFFAVADEYSVSDHEISFDFIDIEEAPIDYVRGEGISSIPTIKVYIDGDHAFDVDSRTSKMIEMELDHELYKRLFQES